MKNICYFKNDPQNLSTRTTCQVISYLWTAQCWTSLHSVICSAYLTLSLSSLSCRILASVDSAIPHLPLSVNSSMLPWHLWKEDDSDVISLTSIFFVAIRVLCTVIYSLKKRGGEHSVINDFCRDVSAEIGQAEMREPQITLKEKWDRRECEIHGLGLTRYPKSCSLLGGFRDLTTV